MLRKDQIREYKHIHKSESHLSLYSRRLNIAILNKMCITILKYAENCKMYLHFYDAFYIRDNLFLVNISQISIYYKTIIVAI